LLEANWGNTIARWRTDLHARQKEYVASRPASSASAASKGFAGIEVDKQNPVRWIRLAPHDHGRHRRRPAGSPAASPALATAAGEVGGPQIRNMGTLGGNLCQRNRCWYFRDEHVNCLLKGGQSLLRSGRARTATTPSSPRATRA